MSRADLREEVRWLRAKLAERDDYINRLHLRLLSHNWKDYSHTLGYDELPQRDYIQAPTVASRETQMDLSQIDEEELNDLEQEAYQDMLTFVAEGTTQIADNLEG